jgi:tRNA (uracil-5-)-methyltransferase TRM9
MIARSAAAAAASAPWAGVDMLRALMTPETARALARINERFYRSHARLFASKRDRAWPGMRRTLDALPAPPRTILDVGCGHGRFAQLLCERGLDASYWGVDASAEMLAIARERRDAIAGARFTQLDVLENAAGLPEGPFDLIAMFGVIHHVPGESARVALLRALAARLAPGGTLAIAFWRLFFGEDVTRRVAWESAGVDARDLEPGDRLLRFDTDPGVYRFSHFADEPELMRLSSAPGPPLALRFDADGADGLGNAYLLWRRR